MGGSTSHITDPVIGGVRLTTSSYGKPIALCYGRNRIPGNLIWYNDFKAIPHTSHSGGKGGGGVSQTSYTYTAAAIMGLCEGPIANVLDVWAGKKQYDAVWTPAANDTVTEEYKPLASTTVTVAHSAAYVSPVSVKINGYFDISNPSVYKDGVEMVDVSPASPVDDTQYKRVGGVYTFHASAIGRTIKISYVWADPAHFAGGCADLGLSTYLGSSVQTAFPYVTTNHPTEALGYRRLAYVAASAYDLGGDANLPNHTFEVDALLAFSGTIYDALPSAITTDFLTNPYHGVGLAASKIGDLTQWANYCTASGLFISPALTDQSAAADFVVRVAKCGNAAPFFSEGVLKVVPYGDTAITGNGATYTPNNTPVYALTDDDFLPDGDDPVIVSRGNPADAFNQVQIQYNNRANQYNQDIAEAKDQANIEIFGLRPKDPETLGDICDPVVARNVAQLTLQRSLYIRNTYRFKLGWRFCLLEPMDIVTLTESSGSGLNNQPVRITSIEENDDGTFNIEAEDYIGGVASHVAYPSQQAGGYSSQFNAAPGPVNPPIIFDAPGRMTDTGYEVWMAVAGSNSALWGGANIYVSTDGQSYGFAGQITVPSRYGYLQSTFAAGSDPDTVDSAAVDFSTSQAIMISGTAADADALNTLCWCDGELFSYQTATLTATSKYTLGTRLRRGVYGTPIGAHAAGKGVVRLDGKMMRYAYDPAMIGKQIWVKFCSFNIYGAAFEAIDGVPAYSYTINGPIGAPADVTGASATPSAAGVTLSWDTSLTPNIAQYEVRQGSTWETASYVGTSLTTTLTVPAVGVGTTNWLVKAIDASGKYSVNATTITLTVSAPSATTVTAQVIDNNVLLFWTAATATQAIKTYEVRRGATWAGATVIGTKTGLFTNVFETVAGTFTYWICAVDIGGNYGTPASTTTTVSAPPDYVLKTNVNSTFNGTLSNAFLEAGAVLMPVNTTETGTQHFTNNGWASPQAQISAGYPLYIEPALTTGSYTEVIDYGSTLAACKITTTFAGTVLAGSVTPSCTITVAQDAGFTTGVQTFAGATQAYAINFRYVKVQITATGAGGANLYRLDSLNIRLDIKLKNDAGTVTWNGNPATATFNLPFVNVQAINLTVMGSTGSIVAVTDFVSVANPTTFKVYLYNSTTGAAPTGPITVAWSVKGY